MCVFENPAVGVNFSKRVIGAHKKPSQQNTSLTLAALPSETVTVTDVAHPLYGLSFPLIGLTIKQRLGRVCVVWLHPGVERVIPLAATNLASTLARPASCRLSMEGLQALLKMLP